MDWWEWIAWGVAVSTGVFGAWRAWKTDRKFEAIEAKWRIEPVGVKHPAHRLVNRLPYRARDVRIEQLAEDTIWAHRWEPTDIGAAESREVMFIDFYSMTSRDVLVKWRSPLGRQRTARLAVPPSPYEPFAGRRGA